MDSEPSISVPQLLRRRTVLVGLVVVLAVSCTDSDGPAERVSGGVSGSPEAESIGGSTGDVKFDGFTEEEIGTEILVDDRLAGLHILARYRTYEDHRLASAGESDWNSMSPAARDRAYFEQAVSLLFLGADDAMPAEVSDAHKELWDAFYRSLDLCVERSAMARSEAI